MTFDAESLQQQMPYYLSAEDRRVLVKELEAIASGGTAGYILGDYHDFNDTMLQGDGWGGFELFHDETGERRSIRGLVLSNSCDVDPKNPRAAPARIIFAPLVKLSVYEDLLNKSRIDAQKIKDKVDAIKAQKTTNMFFLPAGGPLEDDHVVHFDHAHSMPVATHTDSPKKEKLFTLSNTGFYMLVFKLSVHFCRLQEKVNRKSTQSRALS